MFVCFVNLQEVEGFFKKKYRVYGWGVVSKFEGFFGKIMGCKSPLPKV
jgi:hypothetical protein